ncbi:MAG TPA: hypothetical protein VG228_00715 [Solirubrobacteraceae bacterium]|nr:hypothetical protein [Solirubrobacteraceae bacterium]
MAVEDLGHPRRRWLDALSGEAREIARRRQRRKLVALLGTVVVAAAAAGAAGFHFGAATTAKTADWRPRLDSAALPTNGAYWQLTATRGRLMLTGGPGALQEQRVSSIAGGVVPGTCNATTIDPASLRVLANASGSCGDPRLYGQHVLPVTYVASSRSIYGMFTLGLRVAVASRRARLGYRLGPPVVRYPQCSDCGLEWIYGDASLWVYAPLASARADHGPGELFRISEQTGRVLQHWQMPVFTRALLAADADGVWISQSLFGGTPSPMRGRPIDYDSIYRVAPGMRTPQRVRPLGSWGADWIAAYGHTLWVDESDGRKPSRLWRLEGAGGSRRISARPLPSSSDCVQMGENSGPMVVGGPAVGIFCQNEQIEPGVAPPLQAFNPSTGADHSLVAPAVMGASAALGRSVYFIGTTAIGSHQRLYRISAPGA